MTDEEKEIKIAEIETKIKNLKSKLKHSKSPMEQRNIRSTIGKLERESYAIKHNMVN